MTGEDVKCTSQALELQDPGCCCRVARTSGEPEFVTEVIWGLRLSKAILISSKPQLTRMLCGSRVTQGGSARAYDWLPSSVKT